MIEVKHLYKKFNNESILENVNLCFPNIGMYFILGPSGCGKSTLMNILSGLIDYDGEVIINGINLRTLNDEEISKFRLENIGYVYQDFKLFNDETVLNNILLPLKCIEQINAKKQIKRCYDILKILNIYHLKNSPVCDLSGGEKQRVAIGRCLISGAKILLCDEPTGSLDSKTKIEIMSILKTLSKYVLVIVISHDIDLANNYADTIYVYKDKTFYLEEKINNDFTHETKKSLPILQYKISKNKIALPLHFLLRYSKNSIKKRKFRSIITNIVVSFGFLSVGLALLLSDTIYSSVMSVYSNIISDNQVIVSNKDTEAISENIESISDEESNTILEKTSQYSYDDGICYLANFEKYFKDLNHLTLANTTYRYVLRGYSIRHVNDFIWLEDCKDVIYPKQIDFLENDEIVISIDPFMLSEICYQLRIVRTIESLSNYILTNDLMVCFELANNSWQYNDEQIFIIRGFTISNEPTIYHSNHDFNEFVFEEMMRFKTNTNITEEEYYPWILKKIRYIKVNDVEKFLRNSFVDEYLNNYIFEIANKNYYPWLYAETNPRNVDRLLIFKNPFDAFNYLDYNQFKDLYQEIHNPIYSSVGGYSVYGTSLLSGFSNMIFISSSLSLLDETTGVFSSMDFEPSAMVELPEGITCGHYSKTSNDGVFFKTLDNQKIQNGSLPNNYTEFAISTNLANKLFSKTDVIGEEIYLSIVKSQNNNEIITQSFTIVGVIENGQNVIYHDNLWSILFFQTQLGISGFDLVPIGMSFDVNHSVDSQEVVDELSKLYSYYQFLNPMHDIKIQTNKMCSYLEIILWALSIMISMVGVCLVGLCNYLHLVEIRKDIGLLRCLGINKKESLKLLFVHSFLITIIGAVSACLQLLIIFVSFKFGFSKLFNISVNLNFSFLPYLVIFVFSLITGFLSALFLIKKVLKLNPLECLKN